MQTSCLLFCHCQRMFTTGHAGHSFYRVEPIFFFLGGGGRGAGRAGRFKNAIFVALANR